MTTPDSETIALDRSLNEALVNAEISVGYDEYVAIFDRYYAENVEVEGDSKQAPMNGRERILPVLFSILAPLHVMAEVGGLSVTLNYKPIPGDSRNEHHAEWTLELVGVLGRRVTLNWFSTRRWSGSNVVFERHSEHRQLGEPLTAADLDFNTLQRPATGRPS
jgi:hypothetical protein